MGQMLKWLFLLLDSVPVSLQKTRGSGSAENPEERAGGGSFPPPAVRGGPGPPRRRGSPVHSATPNGAAGRGSGGPVSPRSSRGRGGDTRPRPAPLGAAQARQEAGNRRHRLGERRQRQLTKTERSICHVVAEGTRTRSKGKSSKFAAYNCMACGRSLIHTLNSS